MSDDKLSKILNKIDARIDKLSERIEQGFSENTIKFITLESKMDIFATKEDLASMENRLMTHIDGFISLHETLNQELTMLRNRCDRLEERLVKLEKHLPS